jgi:hypothetical protein
MGKEIGTSNNTFENNENISSHSLLLICHSGKRKRKKAEELSWASTCCHLSHEIAFNTQTQQHITQEDAC